MLGLDHLVPFLNLLEKGVLLLLLGLSVWSIGIVLDRRRTYRKATCGQSSGEIEKWLKLDRMEEVRMWVKDNDTVVARSLLTLMEGTESSVDQKEAAFRAFVQNQRLHLEKGLPVLATLGANAPFIGLFGTVLGIIEAFSALSIEQAGTNAIMASIAEALLATATGLFVAIPAVIAFNIFSARLRTLLQECEAVKNLYLSRPR